MPSGLFALLDDISALVKAAAASLDDVPTHVSKTTGKVSGIVIDDAAVTPKYVEGLNPARELAIIYQIAKKSLINKLLILSPAALILGYFASWIFTPILMLGGAYLCFEGYEKVHSIFSKHKEVKPENQKVKVISPEKLEKQRIDGAVRTDVILSAEIVAITYNQVKDLTFVNQAAVLLSVAAFITIAVYGFVALLVKLDDIGLHLAQDKYPVSIQKFGRGLVRFMPRFMFILSWVGTVAMLWVGAGIIAHGLPFTSHLLHDLEHALENTPVIAWFAQILISAIAGLALGFVVERLVVLVKKFLPVKG